MNKFYCVHFFRPQSVCVLHPVMQLRALCAPLSHSPDTHSRFPGGKSLSEAFDEPHKSGSRFHEGDPPNDGSEI